MFVVPTFTNDADEASVSFRWPALDQKLAVKSEVGTVSAAVTDSDSYVESTCNAILAQMSKYGIKLNGQDIQ